MSALVSIQVDWPAKVLFPNHALGHHWSVRHTAKDSAKTEAWSLARRWAGVFPKDCALVVVVAVEPPDARRRDLDNLVAALKPTLDGLAQGLDIDDSQFRRLQVDRLDPVPDGRVTINVHMLMDRRPQ